MALPEANPAVAIQGTTDVKLQHTSKSFNPETGFEEHATYSGPRSAIVGRFNAFVNDGWTVSIDQVEGSPLWKMTVQTIDPYVADRWERVVEWEQIDLRQSPSGWGASDAEELAEWFRNAEDEIASDAPSEANLPGGAVPIFRELARGQTSFLAKWYVLRLRRTVRASDVESAVDVANANQIAYTTASLISAFGVPSAVSSKLPPQPSYTPNDTAWGWRTRTDDVEYNLVYNKAQITKEWVFQALPTVHYAFI